VLVRNLCHLSYLRLARCASRLHGRDKRDAPEPPARAVRDETSGSDQAHGLVFSCKVHGPETRGDPRTKASHPLPASVRNARVRSETLSRGRKNGTLRVPAVAPRLLQMRRARPSMHLVGLMRSEVESEPVSRPRRVSEDFARNC
jgi:hypothetical protein